MSQTLVRPNAAITLEIDARSVDALLEKEWLLTNNRGSYAAGTVIGCNTRRYHGLLVASLLPPVQRVVALSNVLETVTVEGQTFELSNFEFSDRIHPRGYEYLQCFERDGGVHFRYDLGVVTVHKSIYLDPDQDVLVLDYELDGEQAAAELAVMPLVALRDFHALQSSSSMLEVVQDDDVVTARVLDPQGPAVHLCCPDATFHRGEDWWYAFHYRQEQRRGQHDYEDVWAPGVFRALRALPGRLTLTAHVTRGIERPGPMDCDARRLAERAESRQVQLVELAGARSDEERMLVRAADQFVVRRQVGRGKESASILAGYHWFADWGRDTFIALPGLLLATGRYEEALEVLETFGAVLDQGMIPNRFDDYGGAPHYNSVDASLWYVQAAYQYLRATNDRKAFEQTLRPVIGEILRAYGTGTRDHIHADADGLIVAGDADTQLTWMDARCAGVSFTPRHGKAVEVNALWINGLHIAAETADQADQQQQWRRQAEAAQEAFCRVFWNEAEQCLYDCVGPDGTPDAAVRPNQVFAVSLPYSPLSAAQRAAVVRKVEEELYTPYGLRSLSPRDSRYRPYYEGDQFQRDSAYHQGTVWAFLMGPFVEAYLKVNDYTDAARERAREMIAPLLEHLAADGCLGSVNEVFDGAEPHAPRGCVAQAWSVGELLRCLRML